MADEPIFIVGSARSGTTLLQAALGAHPRVAAPPEVHYFLRIARLEDFYGDLREPTNLRRALHDTLDSPLLRALEIDEDRALSRAQVDPSYAGLLRAVMDTIAESWGKPRWSEKTPGQGVAEIRELFPDARVVHIVRDPFAVVASQGRAPIGAPRPRVAAERWAAFNRASASAGATAGPEHYVRIRYEDLVRDPESVLRVIASFIGEPFDEAMIRERSSSAAVSTVAWWQEGARGTIDASRADPARLTLRTRATVAAAVRDVAPSFGYALPPRPLVFLGRAWNALARRLDRARQPSPVGPLSPADRHALVQQLIQEAEVRSGGQPGA